jgi:hypothetical protein
VHRMRPHNWPNFLRCAVSHHRYEQVVADPETEPPSRWRACRRGKLGVTDKSAGYRPVTGPPSPSGYTRPVALAAYGLDEPHALDEPLVPA